MVDGRKFSLKNNFFSWYNFGTEIDVNVLTDWWTKVVVIASIVFASAAFVFGTTSLIWSNRISRKDRKERILGYTIDWATEIHTASLKREIPYIPPAVELQTYEMEIIPQAKTEIAEKLMMSQRR